MEDNSALIRKPGKKKRLLVEGSDDFHTLFHLLKYYHIFKDGRPEDNPFELKSKEGIENILDILPIELKGSELGCLGIIVDADADLSARWESLRERLIRAGYSALPATPDPNGTIIEQADQPIVGIWLMPDNTLPGILEDFASFLIPSNDANDVLWPLSDSVVQQVITVKRLFRESYFMKARIHTWLAWQEEPGTPLGLAITRRYLDATAPHAQQLVAWIRQLFDLGTI